MGVAPWSEVGAVLDACPGLVAARDCFRLVRVTGPICSGHVLSGKPAARVHMLPLDGAAADGLNPAMLTVSLQGERAEAYFRAAAADSAKGMDEVGLVVCMGLDEQSDEIVEALARAGTVRESEMARLIRAKPTDA